MPTITGTSGFDTLTGTAGNDEMYGLDGYDTFIESPGDDLIDGGSGIDTVQYDNNAPPENITANLQTGIATGTVTGTDTLRSIESISTGSGDDNLTGTDGSDTLNAGSGRNTINAGAGDDFIVDRGTGSNIDGGAGDDILQLTRTSASPFSMTFTPGVSTTLADGTTIQNIEHLDLYLDGTGNDVVTFVRPIGSNGFDGGDGIDTVIIDLGNATAGLVLFRPNSYNMASISIPDDPSPFSTAQNPSLVLQNVEMLHLTGGSGDDRFDGGDGDDIFNGAGGNDVLLGNGGNDTLQGGIGGNVLDGGSGTDTAVFAGTRASYSITPNANGSVTVTNNNNETNLLTNIEFLQFSDQTIASPQTGGTPKITITGTSRDNHLYGSSASETISGEDGNDWLIGEGGNDVLIGGNGTDTAYFHGENAYINLVAGTASSAFDGNDTLSGVESIFSDGANTTIIGDDGPNQFTLWSMGVNTIVGGGGNDQFYGGSGDDNFRGGTGVNSLDGGGGTNTAAYARAPGNYIVTLNGDSSYTVKAPDASDKLINIGQASFDATGQTLSLSEFAAQSFNPLAYVASYGDLIRVFGTNRDAAVGHYMTQGYYEGRTASFNALDYTASYGDLIRAFGTNQNAALNHYIAQGFYEGRTASFNALDYIASYGDLINAFGTNQNAALNHYVSQGFFEGRTANFNVLAYTASYADLIQTFGNNQAGALNQYLTQGFAAGRSISFNAQNYIASYGDLINAFGENQTAALNHYVSQGYFEGRTVSFDPVAYLLTYPDLQNAGLTAQTAATHYIDFGYREGRTKTGAFGTEQTQHILTLGTQAASSLTSGDKDWFSIDLTAGHAYDFSLSGAVSSSLADPYLELRNSHGVLIAQDNDSGPGTDALVHFNATTTGTYYLVAASNIPGATGNYKILAANG